jgi:hypothetical protein
MLLEQRKIVERPADDRHLEVVAAACAILDADFGSVGKGLLQQHSQPIGRHRA